MILLAYDVVNSETFDDLEEWVKEIDDNADPNVMIYLVGNRIDLTEEREVTTE